MSIIAALQSWLEQYPGMQIQPLADVLTDLTKPIPSSYALAPAGNSVTQTYITGKRTYTNNYVFYARESILDEADRVENHDFLEGFTEWIEERAENEDFPELSGGYVVDSIGVSNLLLFDVDENGIGTYQVQIQTKITKWRTT